VFATLSAPEYVLHLSAPGYQPLGDPASPNPGVTVEKQPGPGGRVTRQPGPVGLPGGTQIFEGLRLAIMLMPDTGCATPRTPRQTAVSGKVLDLATGLPVPSAVIGLLPEPETPTAVNPGPVQVVKGIFKVSTLACGDYTMTLDAAGSVPVGPENAFVVQHENNNLCDTPIVSGKIAGRTSTLTVHVEERFQQFIAGYEEVTILSQAEIRVIPWLMIEALIAEAVLPIATTGTFGKMEGVPFLNMVRRKLKWMQGNRQRLADLLAG
jgi:hypothetical protein